MDVRLAKLLYILVALSVINAKNVKSKPGTLEDTYGELTGNEQNAGEDVQNDDYDDYGPGDETGDVPEENGSVTNDIAAEFRTKPEVFIAHLGDVVKLPCEVTNSEVVLVWRKDETKLLYQGDIPIKTFPNIKKTSNGLEINITSDEDFGKYACQMMISASNSPKITHTIVFPSPAMIESVLPADNKTVYSVGETLQLTCRVTGYPKPKISWHKDSERLGTEGEQLIIPNLKFENAGIYRCLADNNINPVAHGHVEIHIEHKPVVTIDKYFVNSDKEHDAELRCTVHAYPSATVVWKIDGMNIKADPPKVVLKRHQNNVENILLIKNLTETDFGQYTCSATNQLGKVEKNVTLVRTPAVQQFVKPDKGNRDVVLTWKVESKSPATEHKLQYRRKGEGEWKNLKPEVTKDGDDLYTVKYTLKGLEPGSYETRARSQNSHGWSDYSEVMPFEGVLAKSGSHHKHNKNHHKEKKEKQALPTTQAPPAKHQENETPVGESNVSGTSPFIPSMYLTSIALLALLYRQ